MYATPDRETHSQADELVDAIYGDNHPPGLRRYGVFDSYLGDTEAELLTKEEATTWHHQNPDWVHVSYVSEDVNRNRCLKAYREDGITKYVVI